MKKIFYTFLILTTVVSACKKESSNVENETNSNAISVSNGDANVPKLFDPNFKFHNDTANAETKSKRILTVSALQPEQPQGSSLPILQYFRRSDGKHFYTTNPNELGAGANGFEYEGTVGYLGRLGIGPVNSAVYRYVNVQDDLHYYSMNKIDRPKYTLEGIIGYAVFPPAGISPQPMYEYYAHLDYVYGLNQQAPPGYELNGVAFYATRYAF
ncbi:hypothetical protein KHS38_08485 [Mucilaginibacter sp. Bleaf8]|uniref:hypothetical protein n=1 Tax=Mucilaginibacter sp. Bleaf8 TaxID=2834430 RepID=UPI001BCDF0F0|nr:hypothetical protein [Mucilaginibacter sp. Bleaf8]MBS7564443.1 hypothetical protein [Mucilaginibacter sp. Bleaf8]